MYNSEACEGFFDIAKCKNQASALTPPIKEIVHLEVHKKVPQTIWAIVFTSTTKQAGSDE